MNFEQQTYQNLMKLMDSNEAFFFKDFNLEDRVYRIFNYNLASWTMFLEPSSRDCRGIMFDVTEPENVKLVSIPPAKFFNYEEGGVDHTVGRLGDKMVKMDGSLISTYLHKGELYLKSKGSLFSEHAVASMKLLATQPELKEELTRLAQLGYTTSLEFTSPYLRIVVPYQKEELTVLGVRSEKDGENFFASKLERLLDSLGDFKAIKSNLVVYEDLRAQTISQADFVDMVRAETEGEGHVVEIVVSDTESYLVKIKNIKYIALHHTKDSVNSPRRLFEAVINEATDDLRSMFADDPYVLGEVEKMENHVQPIFNHIIKTVDNFYEENQALSRKDYAILSNQTDKKLAGLFIKKYIMEKIASGEIKLEPNKDGKIVTPEPINYKEFSIKNRKDIYGIGEDPKLDEEGNVIRPKKFTF